jgi:hypothetical protein
VAGGGLRPAVGAVEPAQAESGFAATAARAVPAAAGPVPAADSPGTMAKASTTGRAPRPSSRTPAFTPASSAEWNPAVSIRLCGLTVTRTLITKPGIVVDTDDESIRSGRVKVPPPEGRRCPPC